MYDVEERVREVKKRKMHSRSRQLVVKPLDGKAAKNVLGMVDTRLFTGENCLHAIQDPSNNLWTLKYVNGGVLPGPLKDKFTSFNSLYNFTSDYFKRRNLEIKEIVDVHA